MLDVLYTLVSGESSKGGPLPRSAPGATMVEPGALLIARSRCVGATLDLDAF